MWMNLKTPYLVPQRYLGPLHMNYRKRYVFSKGRNIAKLHRQESYWIFVVLLHSLQKNFQNIWCLSQQHAHSFNVKCYHIRCKWRFLLKTERTSCVKRRASKTGRRFKRAVSIGSQNQLLIGIALSRNICVILVIKSFEWKNNKNEFATWIRPICSRRIIQNKYRTKISTNSGKVFSVRTQVWCAMLSIVTSS